MVAPDLFDPALVRRYGQRGARYTSYPGTAQFHAGFGVSDYRRAALLSNAAPAKPLSIHVHFPYCADNRAIAQSEQHSTDYLQRLLTEIELQAVLFDRRRNLRKLRFGGRALTFLTIDGLGRIIRALGERFSLDLSSQRELHIEIDPRAVRAATFPELAKLGFNGLSLRVEDVAEAEAGDRAQSAAQAAESLRQARAAGLRCIGLDLIYGLPLQTLASFADTLDSVIELYPDRIAVHDHDRSLNCLRSRHAVNAPQPAAAELRLELLALAIGKLAAAGYVHIGMDQFALPDDDLTTASVEGGLHHSFQGYSTGADCDLIGLGVGAISCVGGSYAQNCTSVPTYLVALEQRRLPIERGVASTMVDRIRAEVVQRLLCDRSVSFHTIERTYAIHFQSYFRHQLSQLAQLESDGLVHVNAVGIHVTARGGFLLHNIVVMFDRRAGAGTGPAYSKAG